MSLIGTKRTLSCRPATSAFGGKADIVPNCSPKTRRRALPVTSPSCRSYCRSRRRGGSALQAPWTSRTPSAIKSTQSGNSSIPVTRTLIVILSRRWLAATIRSSQNRKVRPIAVNIAKLRELGRARLNKGCAFFHAHISSTQLLLHLPQRQQFE